MNTPANKITLTTIFVLALFIISCNKPIENRRLNQESYNGFKSLLDEIHALQSSFKKEDLASIKFTWNKSSNTLVVQSMDFKKADYFPLAATSKTSTYKGYAYEVGCCMEKNKLESWMKGCNGSWSCGTLLEECLESQGDEDHFEAEIIYIPQQAAFILKN